MGQINNFPINTTDLAGVEERYQPEALLAVEQGAVTQVPQGVVIDQYLAQGTQESDEISNVLCVSDDSVTVYQTNPSDVVSYGLVPQISGDWKYIKLINGLCVLWCRKTISSVAMTTASGSSYKAASDTEISFPFTVYNAVANVNLAGSGTSTYMVWSAHTTPWQGKVGFRPMCSQSVTLDVIASVVVFGNWT